MNLIVPQVESNQHNPIICFSHLRWDFVLQRPQHLMARFARDRRVFFFEEHIPTDHPLPYLELHPFEDTGVIAVRPRIPHGLLNEHLRRTLSKLLDHLILMSGGKNKPLLWFYTPMMYPLAAHIEAEAVVYDCMDELSNFRFAPPEMRSNEELLLRRADIVFTGGYSIYEAKRSQHTNIHPFPSSVDVAHFNKARLNQLVPLDQQRLNGPIFGYYGVIDERIDLGLIDVLAKARPDWSFVLIGPVLKVAEADLPRSPNITYLGRKDYSELPAYVSGWDVALMPFAINEATRFISPTKTPEYLACGKPVVSTPVADVVRHYNDTPAVLIADGASAFLEACEGALELSNNSNSWLSQVDEMLSASSWDKTADKMKTHINSVVLNAVKAQPTLSMPSVSASTQSLPYDYLIVGAGFAGSVLAERLASVGKKVYLCDRRPHIAGNTYDFYDEAGILVHKYGPHIFHTNSDEIFAYLSRFTRWRPYEHRVLASVREKLLPMPINRTTLNELYDLDLRDEVEAEAFLKGRAEPVAEIRTSKDVVVSQIGTDLYRAFFEGYTRKQWGLDPSDLDKAVTARVPTRTTIDDRYFLDAHQAMPADGYTHLFENMLDHSNIRLALGVDYRELDVSRLAPKTIFTGPIDSYFNHRFGPLPYRSLDFRHETLDCEEFQQVAVVNYPSETVPYTRITEYKHLTGQTHALTSISYEFAKSEGEPYYPIPRPENQVLYKKYEALAHQQSDVIFVGRLGTYKYYNMDQVVGQALSTFRRLMKSENESSFKTFAAAE